MTKTVYKAIYRFLLWQRINEVYVMKMRWRKIKKVVYYCLWFGCAWLDWKLTELDIKQKLERYYKKYQEINI